MNNNLSAEASARLHNQLVKLGDMMGDGLHHEPDGKWISSEYKRILKALGMMPKGTTSRNNAAINAAVEKAISEKPCPTCSGQLRQKRKGSYNVECMLDNTHVFKLKTKRRSR